VVYECAIDGRLTKTRSTVTTIRCSDGMQLLVSARANRIVARVHGKISVHEMQKGWHECSFIVVYVRLCMYVRMYARWDVCMYVWMDAYIRWMKAGELLIPPLAAQYLNNLPSASGTVKYTCMAQRWEMLWASSRTLQFDFQYIVHCSDDPKPVLITGDKNGKGLFATIKLAVKTTCMHIYACMCIFPARLHACY
jgi:hypothetical protein